MKNYSINQETTNNKSADFKNINTKGKNMENKSIFNRTMILFMLLSTSVVVQTQSVMADCSDWGNYAPYEGNYPYDPASDKCWNDYDHLMDYLMHAEKRNRTMRVVQPRNNRDAPMSVHNQYYNACFFFAAAPILEYLGYSRFERFGSWNYNMRYKDDLGRHLYDFDVGYRGSAEHLIAMFYSYETTDRIYRGTEDISIYPGDFLINNAGNLELNLNNKRCDNTDEWAAYPFFEPGQEYGQCQNTTDSFPMFLQHVRGGWDGSRCTGRYDAECGGMYLLNEVLSHRARVAGFRDARNFSPSTPTEIDHMRRIIRAFIDNNLPLIASFDNSGHFMTIVGYADLDGLGLPKTAIVADPVLRVYWTADLLNWHTGGRWSLDAINPWNQHLNRGCEAGGWAQALDGSLPYKYKLCQIHEADGSRVDWPADEGVDPYYGIKLVCQDGTRSQKFFASVEDPFITDENSIDCDKVTLHYVDGEHEVTWARAYRYQYDNSTGVWSRISSYAPDEGGIHVRAPGAGRQGPRNEIVWDAAWRDDYWLVAQGLSGSYTKRRTRILLRLNSGEYKSIEVTPPQTYGVQVQCKDRVSGVDTIDLSRFSEGNRDVFSVNGADHDKQLMFAERFNRDCDSVEVKVGLGYGNTVADAEIRRYYYGSSNEWRPANPVWIPDDTEIIHNGLSGRTYRFTWDDSWPDNYWLVAGNVGSGSSRGDRKTVIRLLDGSRNIIREVEFAPHY